MQATLIVVGLNHRTAPIGIRERFWLSDQRRGEALAALRGGEGIDEVLVFSTSRRTEFVIWGDPTLAVNSVLRFLTAHYNLKLCDWKNFYRLLDEQALAHAFRVGCGLDSIPLAEGQMAREVNAAWRHAQSSGSTGRYLDAILRKTLAVRRRVRRETVIGTCFVSALQLAAELAGRASGSLVKKSVLIVGANEAGETVAKALVSRGAEAVCVVDSCEERARILAKQAGIEACRFEEIRAQLAKADVVICASAAPNLALRADEMTRVVAERNGRKLLVFDLGMPRNVEPAVRELGGVSLYDIDDLESSVHPSEGMWEAERQAEEIVLAEARGFKKELAAEGSAPAVVALCHRLDEICRQELESFRLEQGPFPRDQDQLIAAVSARITHKIAGSLARELKGLPETRRNQRTTVTV